MGWSKVKDPQAIRQATSDWTNWLSTGETITAATVTASTGLTVDSVTHDGTTVTYRVSGGTVGADYTATCHISTSSGQQDNDTLTVKVRDR